MSCWCCFPIDRGASCLSANPSGDYYISKGGVSRGWMGACLSLTKYVVIMSSHSSSSSSRRSRRASSATRDAEEDRREKKGRGGGPASSNDEQRPRRRPWSRHTAGSRPSHTTTTTIHKQGVCRGVRSGQAGRVSAAACFAWGARGRGDDGKGVTDQTALGCD